MKIIYAKQMVMPNKPKPFHAPKLAQSRESAHERGYNRRWRKYRDWFLRQPAHRFCATPGCRRAPTVVDHIMPHKGDPELFWDEKNHQALCKACHDAKTAREDGAFGKLRGAGQWPD